MKSQISLNTPNLSGDSGYSRDDLSRSKELRQAHPNCVYDQSNITRILEAVLEQASEAVGIIAPDFRVVAANQSFRRLVKYVPESDRHHPYCFNSVSPVDGPCPDCPAATAMETGLPTSISREFQSVEGNSHVWQITSYPLRDEQDLIIGVSNHCVDLSRNWRYEALALQAARSSAVGDLATSIAHAINNPLSAIIGNAQLLLREVDDSDPVWPALQTIERAGLRASDVVHGLLRSAQQESVSPTSTDVNETLSNVLGLIAHQLEEVGIVVRLDFADNLPHVTADPADLETVWTNLFLNSRDALEGRSERTIAVATTLTADENWIRIDVRDSGQGIPAKHLDKIFDPFYTTKNPTDGTGLGLFICRNLIRKAGGSIHVDSNLGLGTTVRIMLPNVK